MNKEIERMKEVAVYARLEYNAGYISVEEALKKIMPYIDLVNAKSVEIAKKYGVKPRKTSFSAFIR